MTNEISANATTWAARVVGIIAAIGIVLAVAGATYSITEKLSRTQAGIQQLAVKDPLVCSNAGPVTTYCRLDQDLTQRRYLLAASGVSASLWTRYFMCLAGLIMVAVGSIFIIMKLEISQGEIEAQGAGVGLGLKTSSPGLALTLMGGALLAAGAYTPAKFDLTDGPSYIRPAKPPSLDPSDQAFPNLISDQGGPPALKTSSSPSHGK